MTTDKTLADIADKLEKLAAMTVENGATEAEAQSAAAMLAKLLTRYNLTMADVKRSASVKPANDIGIEYTPNAKDRRFQWEEDLAANVAKGFYCRALYQRDRMLFVGAAKDREIAVAVFVRLRAIAAELSTEATKMYSDAMSAAGYSVRELRGTHSLKTFKLSWLLGFAHGIGRKLAETRLAEEANAEIGAQVTALVVVRDAAITQHINNVFGKLRAMQASNARHNVSGYIAGDAAGRRTSITRADLND